jgi:hypothetical protein
MKRKILLSMIFALITGLTNGQSFGALGTQWYYSEHAQGMCPGNCEYLHLESVYDTVVNGKTTHKIAQTYYRQTGDTVHLEPIFLYEQSDTVFMWSFSKSRFLTTYIFNRNIGDTLTLDAPDTLTWLDSVYRLVIDTIKYEIVDGISLKRYETIPLDDYEFSNGFMDRIGGLDWFFPRGATILEAGGPIRCYSDSQIDTSFQTVACDYILYSSIDEFSTDKDIEIYPNPASNLLTIKSDKPIDKIELYDLTGKLLKTTRELNIDFSNLPNGQYIVTIYLKTKQKIEKKVIKNAL